MVKQSFNDRSTTVINRSTIF